jgi:hypothetical protein
LLLGSALAGCGGLQTEGNEAGRFTESSPADGATGVPVDTVVVLVFSEAVKDESAAAQGADGPCADKPVQLTFDGFKTCVAAVASIVPNAEKHKIQLKPVAPLAAETRHEVKATKAVSFDEFLQLEEDAIVSFTTEAAKLPPADGESPAADGDVP